MSEIVIYLFADIHIPLTFTVSCLPFAGITVDEATLAGLRRVVIFPVRPVHVTTVHPHIITSYLLHTQPMVPCVFPVIKMQV